VYSIFFIGKFDTSRQCAALCQTLATWKLESSKMPDPHGYHAFTTMCETFYDGLFLDLLRVLLWHHQHVRREIASYQVQQYILHINNRLLQHALP
jgi:hypothetical protein